jgi:isoquinoline 1-oxidoreductase subunit beta
VRQGQRRGHYAVEQQLGRRDRANPRYAGWSARRNDLDRRRCRTAIDPDIIRAQLTSAAIFGLSATMAQEITFADGMVEQSNFPDCDWLRISHCPAFEVAAPENFHKMSGVGEIGALSVAPALADAIFALTGKRFRSLPLSKEVSFA